MALHKMRVNWSFTLIDLIHTSQSTISNRGIIERRDCADSGLQWCTAAVSLDGVDAQAIPVNFIDSLLAQVN